MRISWTQALCVLLLSGKASVEARAIPHELAVTYYNETLSGSASLGAHDISRRAWSPFHGTPHAPGGPGAPKNSPKTSPKDPSTSPGKNPDGSVNRPYGGPAGGSGHPYDGRNGDSTSTCKRTPSDPGCIPKSEPKGSFASRLDNAAKNPPKEDTSYKSLKDEKYDVSNENGNVVEESAWNMIYPDARNKIKGDLGIDLQARDSVGTKITRSPDGGGQEATFHFYTSASEKYFIVASKYGSNDMKPQTGPLNMRAIQQQGLTQALERSGGSVKPGDMKYFGEVGIVNADTKAIFSQYRGATTQGRVTFDRDSDAFNALSNSDNGRAEFGQLMDNMHSMQLTIDKVDTYVFEDLLSLFWHLRKT